MAPQNAHHKGLLVIVDVPPENWFVKRYWTLCIQGHYELPQESDMNREKEANVLSCMGKCQEKVPKLWAEL